MHSTDMRPFALVNEGKGLRVQPPTYAPEQAPCAVEDSPACVAALAQISAAVDTFFKNSPASAVQIAVRKQGRFLYSKGFGSEDPKGAVPTSNHSLFQIGSNTKKATALAVLRAVQDGAIGLDQTIEEILPELKLARDPEWTQHATVRQLLSHQAGLWDYTPWIDAPEDADLAKLAYGTFAEHEWSTTPPGAVWNYSNSNFAVLGALLEHVYRKPYRKVLEREVYRPLRLRHTFARREEAVEAGHAVWGYGVSPDVLSSPAYDPWQLYTPSSGDMPQHMEWVAPEDEEDNAFMRPAGFTWSTAEDECRVGSFLISGNDRVLDDSLRHEQTTPQVQTSPDPSAPAYGFGLLLSKNIGLGPDQAYDINYWAHDGATMRMSSLFFAFPEQDLALSALTNTTLQGFEASEEATVAWQLLAISIIRAYVTLPRAHAPTPPEPADDGARYAGTYADPLGLGRVVLQWDGSKLTVSAPDVSAQGAKVDENMIIAQKNLLIGTIDGQQVSLEVWPSSGSDAGYLVSRIDSFTRISN